MGPGRGKVRHRRGTGPRRPGGLAGDGLEEARDHWSSAPVASRYCNWTLPQIAALHAAGFEIAVETNGTQPAPDGIDWVCVSPKANAPLLLTSGDELKLVFPQDGAPPERYRGLQFREFYLATDGRPERARNTALAVAYCLRNPEWRAEPPDA